MTQSDDTLVDNFLERLDVTALNPIEQLVTVTKAVAQIPWGEGRSIVEVLNTKKVGTCTGKHLVLQACYQKLNVSFRSVVCVFKWEGQAIQFPDRIRSILEEGAWGHGHNFLQIKNKAGSYIDVDVTFDPPLKRYGFRVLPLEWDGQSSTPIAFEPIIKRWNNADMTVLKTELVDSLSQQTRTRRERFLKEFIIWIDSLHGNR